MGVRNYLIEGVPGAGKTTVAEALQRRGHHVLHGDRELCYRGDPQTGERLNGRDYLSGPGGFLWLHQHHIWNVAKVRALIADHSHAASFFCGGSRNAGQFIDLFDEVFVLEIDRDTLNRRLLGRQEDEFGGKPDERALVLRLHETREDVPADAVSIDATAPVEQVVDEILTKCGLSKQGAA